MGLLESMRNIKTVGAAAAFAAILGTGCNGGPNEEECREIDPDSRPVDGACLCGKYQTVDDLRKSCEGEVIKLRGSCDCYEVHELVWRCVENPTEKTD